jgi:hypothetical protein
LRTSIIRAKKRKLGKLKKYFFIRTEEEKHLARHLHFLAYLPENQFFIEFIYNFRAFQYCLLDIFTGLRQGVSNFED